MSGSGMLHIRGSDEVGGEYPVILIVEDMSYFCRFCLMTVKIVTSIDKCNTTQMDDHNIHCHTEINITSSMLPA